MIRVEPAAEAGGAGVRPAGRARDATTTRRALLQAARRRFAMAGYAGATVREIAAEADVNVALINRYFASKEGLFEACLQWAADDLVPPVPGEVTLERIRGAMIAQVADVPHGELTVQLMLLLRSSGDERADAIRARTLRTYAEQIAATIGWRAGDEGADALLLRAELVLSAVLGVVLMRSSGTLESLPTATAAQLAAPMAHLVDGVMLADPQSA